MAIEDFYQLVDDATGDSLIVDSDGVIVETNIDDPLLMLAQRRHEAKAQIKAYEDYLRTIDQVFLKNQTDAKRAYGDVVLSIRGGRYSTVNGEMFANLLIERYYDMLQTEPTDDEHPSFEGILLDVVAAATGYRTEPDAKDADKPYLKPEIVALLNNAREWHEKRAWVESSVARRPAPKLRVVADPDAEPVPA